MRSAALMQFGSKYASIIAQLIITMILARLVSPSDFGLLAIVTIFTTFFSLFSDMGIGTAIVQFRDLDEKDFGSLFVFSAMLAVVMAGLFCLASFPISWMYKDERLVEACCWASISLVFGILNMIPNGLMLRELRFDAIAIRTVGSAIFSGIVAIALAVLNFGYLSLIAQVIISSATIFVWNIITRPIKLLSFHFVGSLKRIFKYSAFQFCASLINYFGRNLDNLLIGAALGMTPLGYYDKAYKLTSYPMSALSSVIASIIQPYMTRYQDEPNIIYSYWFKIDKALSLIGAVIAALFICSSSEIIELFFGTQWLGAIPIFSILAVTVYVQVISNPSGAFFQSLGRTDLMLKAMIVNTVITLIGLLLGLWGGSLLTVSIGVSVAFCCHLFAMLHFLIYRGFRKSPSVFIGFIPEIITAIAAIIIVSVLVGAFKMGLIANLLCKSIAIIFLCLIGFTVSGQMKYLLALVGRHDKTTVR